MSVLFANNAISKLAANITGADTVLSIMAADAGLFPTPENGDWFPLTIVDASGNMEIVRVTGRAGSALTVQRGQEGTSAKVFPAGAVCDHRLTAGALAGAFNSASDEIDVVSTQLNASIASVSGSVQVLKGNPPAGLDTLGEIAAALGNDANFAATIAGQLADAARLTTGIIPDARLPLSLQPLAQANVITDCNEASRNGWYAIESSGANKPSSLGGYVFTIAKHTDWWVQYFFTQTEDANNQRRWRRYRAGSTWGPWVRIYEAEAELMALIDAQIAASTGTKGSSGILNLAGVSTGLITGIPAGVSKVSVALAPLVAGNNNGNPVGIQLGTGSGIVTAGYSGGYACQNAGNTISYTGTNGAYFVFGPATSWNGLVEFRRFDANKWVWSSGGMLNHGGTIYSTVASGNVDLGAELTQLQIRMSTGAALNSGAMKLFWE